MSLTKDQFLHTINEHQGTIRSLCYSYYSSYADREDAWQDIILQLWKSFSSFRGESRIGTWIYKVSLNTILSRIKKENRKPSSESLNASHENSSIATCADDDKQLLNLIIQSLKEIDKAIIILYLEGYRNKEIADILDLTSSNVSTRMNRIRNELKTKFNQYTHEFR